MRHFSPTYSRPHMTKGKSSMKVALRLLTVYLLSTFVLSFTPRTIQAQDACGSRVSVQLYPLSDTGLERTIESNVSNVLSALNRSDTSGLPESTQNAMAGVGGSFCTFRTSYNALLIPHKTEEGSFEIRGLHLVDRQGGSQNPQLRLVINAEGNITQTQVVTDAMRQSDRAALRSELGSTPRANEVLDIIASLEAAYNLESRQEIIAELNRVLTEADIVVSKLQNGRASSRTQEAGTYIGRLNQIFGTGTVPNVTYEMIEIYPSREEQDQFRVTLVQHWMYPPPGYLDSDYLALDVRLLGEADITLRRAGRGGFSIVSDPANVSIDTVNDREVDLATPHTFINEPIQYHYLDVSEGGWFEIDPTGAPAIGIATPDMVVQRDTIFLKLRHKPAQMVINLGVIPPGVTLTINGVPYEGFQPGEVIVIPPDVLFPPDGDVPSPHAPREVVIALAAPNYAPLELPAVFPSPELVTLDLDMEPLQGTLNVSSVPPASLVQLDGNPLGNTDLTTNLDATGANPPYMVVVRNDACLPTQRDTDCAHHIPSLPQEVTIEPGAPTNLSVALVPFVLRNLTSDATVDAQVDRDGDMVYINYDLENVNGRDSKYRTNLGYMLPESSRIVPLDFNCSEDNGVACLGSVRPGSYGYSWNISDLPDGATPVMVLKRKRARWPWILLPAAAGVAAAYLFPRDGSGGGTFIPPPRPDDN